MTLNLIDTPGHVDFNYEVSRSLAACEGAILVVDASQGVEAQTLANTYLALDHDLEIRPVINKIDLPAANPAAGQGGGGERHRPGRRQEAPEISAKMGTNIQAVLEDIVHHVPAPQGDPKAPFKALIFDSQYDAYRGVVVYFRVMEGTLTLDQTVKMMASGATYGLVEMRPPAAHQVRALQEPVRRGGGLPHRLHQEREGHPGGGHHHRPWTTPPPSPSPATAPPGAMVYCGIYTEDGSKYPDLRDALEKLQLNDASLTFEPETSAALGFGFRCGFLGMLHMEIIQERLEREFDLDLITTLPNVIYEVTKTDGTDGPGGQPPQLPRPLGDRRAAGALS